MLFKKNQPKKDLAQSEREAIVDLLHLLLYADNHLSLKEGRFIADVVEVIGWDLNLSFSSYEARSIAAARAARADEKSKVNFIEHARARLESTASRELALNLCGDLAAADGVATKEGELLSRIRAVLKPA
jgi:hypothetical protein